MQSSRPDILSVIDYMMGRYEKKHGVAPKKVFVSKYHFKSLCNDWGRGLFRPVPHPTDTLNGMAITLTTCFGSIEVELVFDVPNDFIMVGTQDEFLTYAVGETVL